MARAYSQDLRERVIAAAAAAEAGLPARHAADRFGIGIATAIVWVRRARETGERMARPQGQPRRSKLDRKRCAEAPFPKSSGDVSMVGRPLVGAAPPITADRHNG